MKYLEAEGSYNPPHSSTPASPAIAIMRGINLLVHLLYGSLLALVYPLLNLTRRQWLMRHWSSALLDLLHVQLEIIGEPPARRKQGTLLVANHISWLDVFVMNAACPANFVAKSEVRSWPLIGQLCRLTRTIFIKRDLRSDTRRANRAIAAALNGGNNVALFPEGTSTDGRKVGHFHCSLLQCAIDAHAALQPVAIRYHDGSGRRSDTTSFIDDMSLLQSLHRILRNSGLHARLVFLPEMCCTGKNRRALGSEAHHAISIVLSEHGTAHNTPAAVTAGQGVPHYPLPTSQSMYSLLLEPSISKFKPQANP